MEPIYFVVALLALLAAVSFVFGLLARRALRQYLNDDYDPFSVDLASYTSEVKITRAGKGKKKVTIRLLDLLACMENDNSVEVICDNVTKLLELSEEDKITPEEMRILLLHVSPLLIDMERKLKKVSPFGTDSPGD